MDGFFSSPAAKKLAGEKGINISQITKGSGMDGMITTKDVENFALTSPAASVGAGAPSVAIPSQRYGGMPAPMGSGHSDAEITNMRKTIAKVKSSNFDLYNQGNFFQIINSETATVKTRNSSLLLDC